MTCCQGVDCGLREAKCTRGRDVRWALTCATRRASVAPCETNMSDDGVGESNSSAGCGVVGRVSATHGQPENRSLVVPPSGCRWIWLDLERMQGSPTPFFSIWSTMINWPRKKGSKRRKSSGFRTPGSLGPHVVETTNNHMLTRMFCCLTLHHCKAFCLGVLPSSCPSRPAGPSCSRGLAYR